jgi:hypothetical protein
MKRKPLNRADNFDGPLPGDDDSPSPMTRLHYEYLKCKIGAIEAGLAGRPFDIEVITELLRNYDDVDGIYELKRKTIEEIEHLKSNYFGDLEKPITLTYGRRKVEISVKRFQKS